MSNGISFSGKKLAKLRREKWFSQEGLARAIGISKTRMSAIETADRAGMYLENFKILADVLKIAPEALLQQLAVDKHFRLAEPTPAEVPAEISASPPAPLSAPEAAAHEKASHASQSKRPLGHRRAGHRPDAHPPQAADRKK